MNKIKALNLCIPEDWDIKKLDSITNFSSGGTPRRNIQEYWVDGTIPWLKSGELNDDFIYKAEEKITELGLNKSSAKILEPGTLLYALYGKGTVSKTGLLSNKMATNQAIAGITPKNELINTRFLQYFLIFTRKRILANFVNPSTDTGRTNIYLNDLKTFKIPLPSLKEQDKIVTHLSNIDLILNQTQNIIEYFQIIKKGVMQRLFTQGIGHSEFKDSKLGKIPKEWDVVRIFDIGEVIGGGTPDTKNDDYWNGDILWATPTDITSNTHKYISKTQRKITREGLNKSSAKILPPFSILLTSRASIGYCSINTSEICTNQGLQNIIPNERINVEFLYYMIQNEKIQDQLIRNAYGSTFLEIPNKDVKKIRIPLPDLKEQELIIHKLSNIENSINKESEINEQLKKIKKGLMQDLLTGKKRVKLNN